MRPQRGSRRALGDGVAVGFGVAVAVGVGAGAGAAAGAGGGAGTGTAAAGLIRVCGWAGASGPKAPVGSSSARPDRLARSDRRIERAAASISAASATSIWAAAGVATPSGSRGRAEGDDAGADNERQAGGGPQADRPPRQRIARKGSTATTSRGGVRRPRGPLSGQVESQTLLNTEPQSRPKSHIQVTVSYTSTHPLSAEVRHREDQRVDPPNVVRRSGDHHLGTGDRSRSLEGEPVDDEGDAVGLEVLRRVPQSEVEVRSERVAAVAEPSDLLPAFTRSPPEPPNSEGP